MFLSAEPVERLVHAEKKTWLDKELFKQAKKGPSIPYDAGVSQALAERRDWLVKQDLAYIQSNGEFALRGKSPAAARYDGSLCGRSQARQEIRSGIQR